MSEQNPTDAQVAAPAADTAEGPHPASDAVAAEPQRVPHDLAWAQGFHMAVRAFASERQAGEIHITVTLASGEQIPVISVGPGGPPGFVGFGVETEGLREQIEEGKKPIPSPRGVYVPIGSIAKVEFSADHEEAHAIGFRIDSALDEA
ncbi:MAG: hypothetical protein OER93_01215 [Thermoleophilia bacterium]|nr:hypothetical protein [Thermoleophilia bacterium]